MGSEAVLKDTTSSSCSSQKLDKESSEVIKEDLQAARKIERFDIPLDNLKMMFEKSTAISPTNKEVRPERASHSPASKRQLGSNYSSSVMDLKDSQTEDNMFSKSSLDNSESAGSTDKLGTGISEEASNQNSSAPLDNQETVSLKERLAMYQAAVSKKEAASTSNPAVEESEVCSMPGGLASVKKQFESQEMSSSHNTVTQYHYQHKSVQAVEESEVCSMPGGLANVKKQFESQEMSSSHSTVTQYHYQHKSVQEVSSTEESSTRRTKQKENVPSSQQVSSNKVEKEVSSTEESSTRRTKQKENVPSSQQVSSNKVEKEVSSTEESSTRRTKQKENVPSSQQVSSNKVEKVTHDESKTASFENHYDETVKIITGEELPKVSTQLLKQQFEKTVQENTQTEVPPSKNIKIDHDFNQMQWSPYLNTSNKTETGRICETSATNWKIEGASAAFVSAGANTFGSMEDFPPPPPDLLQIPSEMTEPSSSPKPSMHQSKHAPPKEQYSKQRNLFELKRLYKHIHPEVRKNLERDYFSDVTELETTQVETDQDIRGDVQQARYVFEHTGHSPNTCMSPEREYLEWDEILKGEVQSMRWMFENQPLDSIKDETPDQDNITNISQQETIAGGDVKYTTWMFETQPIDALGTDTPDLTEQSAPELARGDVRTATWLFETQPLDILNTIYQEEEQSTEIHVVNDITGGDVKTARYLFETQHLDALGHTDTVDEGNFLQLKSELEEIKGDVKTTTRLFETQPMCVIRGTSGEMLEITTVRREEIERGDVRTSRWLFETQPLDMINKDATQIKVICGVSMEDNIQGGVNRGKWLFETQPLDTIKEQSEMTTIQKEEIIGADVSKQCWIFETQPMAALKDDSNTRPVPTEEIVGGDVQKARHLFETVPMDYLKESQEVGKLQKVVASEEEKGDVRHQKWVFESQPLEHIREEKKEYIRTVNLEELDKGDVSSYKEIFETMDLSTCDDSQKIQVEGVTSGYVKSNKVLFESTPLYAVQDSFGQYHKVKTVRREEIVKGDVRSCKWMFETRPIDQFDESIQKFQIIKGISKQEIESGDVKTAKWLFETQPLDAIKYFSNVDDGESQAKESADIVKGDVKTCRWLFETQPMDGLYKKADMRNETEEIQKGDVKTCTWLFETQALDTIRDESETIIQTCTVRQEDIQGRDVRMARFLFETENLENIKGEEGRGFRRVTEIDVQSGDVSRMKCIFENQTSDMISSTSEETFKQLKSMQAEDIQKGNVVNCTRLFENQPIDSIRESSEESKDTRTVTDVQGGNVNQGRFIFETFSLDKIQDESSETEKHIQTIRQEEIEKGDVKNYTMLFETQPLYAIRDKEGYFHEVTTVTKEEVMRGDVVGARWLFETKPLDSIKDSDEVYVIKAVTQEDVQKGDVSSARWRFETQPLDTIAEDRKVVIRTVDDVQGGDVKINKHIFESNEVDKKQYVRTVSVSEIQQGDVRTATWLFETHTMDEIRGEGSEYNKIKTVQREDVLQGDVKQSVWLFEKQPLDSINETDETDVIVAREEFPQADVKTTTWLFETTPFHEFNESITQKHEIMGKSIKETLQELYSHKVVDSHGILLETDEIGDVRMAKFNLMNQEAPEIQKEEIIRGDLQSIMINLLNKQNCTEKGIVIDDEEKGHINTTVAQLFNKTTEETKELIQLESEKTVESIRKEQPEKTSLAISKEQLKNANSTVIKEQLEKASSALSKEQSLNKQHISLKETVSSTHNQRRLAESTAVSSTHTSSLSSTKHHTSVVSSTRHPNMAVSSSEHQTTSDIEKHPSTTLVVSSAAEQLESILNTCSDGQITKQEILHGFKELSQNESTKKTSSAHKEEQVRVSCQPSKIPKVTPRFKVKTFKMPKDEHDETNIKEKSTQKMHQHKGVTIANVPEDAHLTTSIKQHVESEIYMKNVEQIKNSEQHSTTREHRQDHQPQELAEKPNREEPFQISVKVIPKETKPPVSGKPTQDHEEVVKQKSFNVLQKEHEVHEQTKITESKVQRGFQQHNTVHLQKQLNTSQKQKQKGEPNREGDIHVKSKPANEETRVNPIKLTEKQMHKREEDKPVTDITDALRKREEVKQILFHITALEIEKNDLNAAKVFLSKVPEWLVGQTGKDVLEKVRAEGNLQKVKEAIVYIQNQAYAKLVYFDSSIHATPVKPVSDKDSISGATPKISKISIGSSKFDTHRKTETVEEKTWHGSVKQGFCEAKTEDQIIPSPLVRIRSPSPSYITIESTARQRESPQRVIASPPPLMQRVATPPAPPPRRSETPTSKISRASATPSPPISRAEKLAKLKDTTAKLHQGVSQPQLAPPVLVTEKKSEIIVSPASLHRQLKIGTHVMETTSSNVVSESSVMSGTVKDMREFYEEAVKEDEHKIYSRKGPIDIPQHLGPDAKLKDDLPKVDLSELLHRFETPVEKVYVRKEPIVIAERLGSDNEGEAEKKTLQIEDMPALDVKAIKTVFESGAQSYHVKEEKLKSGKIESGLMSGEKVSKENSPQPIQKEVCQEKSCEPTSCCETKSMKEQFSGVDEFGNRITGLKSATTASQHSESIKTRRAPPTYSDVLKGNIPALDVPVNASPEELLKNFQKTWQESERVFKSLGYNVTETEESTSQTVMHQEGTFVTGNLNKQHGDLLHNMGVVCLIL
ncbi:UNVERIFIED_CONTAM: hypothetical protein FKN15_014457 [Acipenser sinensis]